MTPREPLRVERIAGAGDSALLLEFPQRIDPEINRRARATAAALRERWSAILRDVVVGYCSVTVFFDPLHVDAPWLESELRAAAAAVDESETHAGQEVVVVPVCYDGDLAPDLADVAAFAECSTEEVVALHTGVTYQVYLLGFVPGFAYMGQVDPRIAAPRRATPRTVVPAGSVGIAGEQTGIYPSQTPGGWNIIGRTPLRPYDPRRTEPFLFHPGDLVRFERISAGEFQRAG